MMHSTHLWICASIYTITFATIQTGIFKLIDENYQFGQHGKIAEFAAMSAMICAVECVRVDCRSFSHSESNLCTLSHLQVQDKISDQSVTFVIEQGTKIFSTAGK